ncbi:MAG: prepilin-type N-terminal cleavage/methylation domain-containing protein [Synergistaceae bacterium]|nr:prepilin-type N-terminal cleavage/methylation domain-containing protein [Synergistaceae bacterium]
MTRRKGFTLLEILIVVIIIGMMASVAVPRISMQFEPYSAVLQRAFEEAGNLALSGTPVRLSVKKETAKERGTITAEALRKKEEPQDSLSVFLGTAANKPVVLEWQKLKLKNAPEGDGWKFNPEIIYFYTDGSCSPARISYAPRGVSDVEADEYVLTVTGYCVKIEKN